MGWNYLSIPNLQRVHRWSLGMDKLLHPTLYNGYDYISMLGLKLNHVSKRGYWWRRNEQELQQPWYWPSSLITMTSTWTRWRLKSPASRVFTQSFIQAQIKENIKAPRHWPLCWESPGTGEFPAQIASNAEMFPFDDFIMISASAPQVLLLTKLIIQNYVTCGQNSAYISKNVTET